MLKIISNSNTLCAKAILQISLNLTILLQKIAIHADVTFIIPSMPINHRTFFWRFVGHLVQNTLMAPFLVD